MSYFSYNDETLATSVILESDEPCKISDRLELLDFDILFSKFWVNKCKQKMLKILFLQSVRNFAQLSGN